MSDQTSPKGASRIDSGPGAEGVVLNSGLKYWANSHKNAFHRAVFHLSHNLFATIITILVIATTLALPAIFQVFVSNIEGQEKNLSQQAGISIFLNTELAEQDIEKVMTELQQKISRENMKFISAETALEEFKAATGLSGSEFSDSNPIPPVIYLTPNLQNTTTKELDTLKNWLGTIDGVDLVQMDIQWIKQLFSIVTLIKNSSILISLFLIFTVLVIVGNTIRLLAQHYYDEIMVSKLMGATDAYVRRPFLYSGLLFGLSGALLACILVYLGILWLLPEIQAVMAAYGGQFSLTGLGFSDILSLLGIGALLGMGGAWVSSNRIINEISI